MEVNGVVGGVNLDSGHGRGGMSRVYLERQIAKCVM